MTIDHEKGLVLVVAFGQINMPEVTFFILIRPRIDKLSSMFPETQSIQSDEARLGNYLVL
jgi:hypothetical protein